MPLGIPSHLRWTLARTLVLHGAAVLALAAQSPTDRAMLAAWDDTLQQITDPTALDRLSTLARAGTTPAKDFRRSLFQARSAILRDNRSDFELALDNLGADLARHNDWPWVQMALARVFFEMERRKYTRLPTATLQPLEPYLTGAWRHLNAAYRRDQTLPATIRLANDVLLAMGDRTLRPDELIIVREAVLRPLPHPDFLLVWGRHLRSRRLYDSARKVFVRASLAGGDYSRLALERARTYLTLDDSAAATIAYWDGVERLSPAGRALYHLDLAWIISADSLATFDRLPDAAVEPWLRRFWNQRDAYSANLPGDRVMEHLRRWGVVNTQYRLMEPWHRTAFTRVDLQFDNGQVIGGPGWSNTAVPSAPCIPTTDRSMYDLLETQPTHAGDVRARELLLDHRGVVYLRHGEPLFRMGSRPLELTPLPPSEDALPKLAGQIIPPELGTTKAGRTWLAARGSAAARAAALAAVTATRSAANESWIYWIAGSYRNVTFKGSQALGGYAATTLKGFLPFSTELYAEVGRYIPEYAVAAKALAERTKARNGDPPACFDHSIRAAVALSRADANVTARNDSDSPPISEPWAAVVRTFALGHAGDGSGKALVTFAFGAKDLVEEFQSSNGLFLFPIRLRVVAYQAATDRVIQLDTLRYFYSRSRTGWVSGWVELALPGGEWQVATYARQGNPKGGAYSVRGGLQMDSAATFTLSDLVTGRPDAPGWLAPDRLPFPVNPVGFWANDSRAELYFEVRGLVEDAPYQTIMRLREPGAKGKVLVELRTTDRAVGPLTPVRKSLSLEKLTPGDYELLLSVEATGKRAERSTTIRIAQR